MTLQEVCEKYEVAESSMKNMFPRTQRLILKKYGIRIIKIGKGKNADYREEVENDMRAVTMYDEVREDLALSNESLKLMNWDFMCFLAIITTPMMVFRGSYEDFLRYAGCKVTQINIKYLKTALQSLFDRELIEYRIDKTDRNYFFAGLYRQVEKDMRLGIEMIRECRILAAKYHKHSWTGLLKVWLGVQILSENKQPFTMKEVGQITGLSDYQVKDSMKILKESEIFKTTRAYIDYRRCIGATAEFNAFYGRKG